MNHPEYPARYGLHYKNEKDHSKYYYKCPQFTHKNVISNMDHPKISPYRWSDDKTISYEKIMERLTFIGSNDSLHSIKDANINLDKDNYPINPVERTGIRGRGLLGKWGPNHAADPIIAYQDSEGVMWAIVVRRKDTNQYAIPGGMVDAGDSISQTLVKELQEEAVDIDKEYLTNLFKRAIMLYNGYVCDPRNTDNAWIETCVYGVLISEKEKEKFQLKDEDSEHNTDSTKWIRIDNNSSEFNNMYADHKWYLRLMKAAIRGLSMHNNSFDSDTYSMCSDNNYILESDTESNSENENNEEICLSTTEFTKSLTVIASSLILILAVALYKFN